MIYNLLLRLALPAVLLRLYWKGRTAPDYRTRIAERFTWGSPAPVARIWLHAVSVGEVQAAAGLIKYFLQQAPSEQLLVTTTTPTGAERLHKLFNGKVTHRYIPYDLPKIVNRFLNQVHPSLVIFIETEIWPNFLLACTQRKISVILANARLSAQSARRYAWFARFTRTVLQKFTLIAAQTEQDAQRFLQLGASPEKIKVTGNLKFDWTPPENLLKQAQRLKETWGTRPIWVAGSTHAGEEVLLLQAHRHLINFIPKALLILVPRHPERFDLVAKLIAQSGFNYSRHSQQENYRADIEIILGDSMGELPIFFAAGDIAFIGGSLVPQGGHNPLEAAAVGVPIIIGPYVFNISLIIKLLIAAGAATQINNIKELTDQLYFWLQNELIRKPAGEQGRYLIKQQQGTLERLINLINLLKL